MDIQTLIHTQRFVVPVVAIVSASAGATAAYLVLNTKLERKYAERADREIEESKQALERKYKVEAFAGLAEYEQPVIVEPDIPEIDEEEVRTAARILTTELGYVPYNKAGEKPEAQSAQERIEVVASQRKSVWDDQPIVETFADEFDLETEKAKRTNDAPYILQHDEFYDNENDNQQFTFTYYEGDDVMTDENGAPIDKAVIDRNLGLGNLRFGYGTQQKDTVLIHNPISGNDYEIVREKGLHSIAAYGFDPDEPDDERPRRFRSED